LEGQTCLLSGGAPDSPVHHQTVTVDVRCAITFQIRRIRPLVLGVGWRTGHCPVHTGQSGAHRTVRCAQPTIVVGHTLPMDCAADCCAGDRWLIGQSGAPPDNPVNYSRTPPSNPESGEFTMNQPGAPDTVPCTTAQSGVPDRVEAWLHRAKSFPFPLFFISHCF
jgi:hypothetical protein